MLTSVFTMLALMVTIIIITMLLTYLLSQKTNRTQIHNIFILISLSMLFWLVELVLQAVYSPILNINPIYFDYLVYINACFFPVLFLLLSISFTKTKIKFTKKYLLLFLIPILSILLLWTNNYHHLFYQVYSTNISENIYGAYFYIHTAYTLLLYLIGIFIFIRYSIKNLSFFSKQAILIIIGTSIPLATNLLGFFGIITSDIYITPITFALAILFIALAIFKFDFLKVAPIALQRVVDRMSDGYVIVNEENVITDFNQTFLNFFSVKANEVRNVNISHLINKLSNSKEENTKLLKAVSRSKSNNKTVLIERYFPNLNKYFNIEINSIRSNNAYLGTLVLLKDVTQHNIDMQTIKDNQEILVEKERLASLGQMIGGIAHNLKTPIMSIAGAAEGLKDLINEYDSSIGDKEVTEQDHHEIAHDMSVWISKIDTHLSYMSDIITAVKGQAVAFSDNTFNGFTVDELVKHIDILMRHELKNALIDLKTDITIPRSTKIRGNINSLVQVINNIISNAIQAYDGKPNQSIVFSIAKKNSNMVISIEDFAGGLPENVQEKLFKEMVTTKGKNGTGLGLFMSYSNIKAHFNGTMSYKTKEGKGTTFYIEIPL